MSKFKKKKKSNKNNQSGSKFEQKFLKHYDEREAELLRSYEVPQLRKIVAECQANVMRATKEVQENPEYIALKEKLADFNAALKEVRDYQDAKKMFTVQLLHERGVVDAGLSECPYTGLATDGVEISINGGEYSSLEDLREAVENRFQNDDDF
jgi:hypothetical protein